MPYKREGNVVYTKSSGKWRVKQHCKSVESAKAAIRLLESIKRSNKGGYRAEGGRGDMYDIPR